MTIRHIAGAMHRVENVLRRKPDAGRHDDAPAAARWTGGAHFVASHPNGVQVATDMPAELGGTGDEVTPGWLFRAGLAACSATSILMAAAAGGVELTMLEVVARSRSDTRGLLGMNDADGELVYGGPGDVSLNVRIAAEGIEPQRLREIVQSGVGRSPVPNAVTHATPLDLRIEVATGS